MNSLPIDAAFAPEIFPSFPFREKTWLAVAFERDRYDNTRMPEPFFRSATTHFNRDGTNRLMVKGDAFSLAGQEQKVVEVPFEWHAYRRFLLSPQGFSIEYKMVAADLACACWADAELTVFGGEPKKMTWVLNEHGGAKAMLASMEREFFLQERSGNEDMRAYLRALLFPELRSNRADS